MVDHAFGRQTSGGDKTTEKKSGGKVLNFKYVAEDFAVLESDFGHADISLCLGVVKKFDLITRKYFCNKEVGFDVRIPFGRVLNEMSTLRFMPDCDDVRLALICLAQKANDLVYDFTIDKFDSEAFRRCFIDVSNIVLLELKKLVLRPKPIDPERKSGGATNNKIVYKTADLADPKSDVPEPIKTRFNIKAVMENASDGVWASREDLIRFHCWKLVKLDTGLQQSIKMDLDDLFYQVLPLEVEEYVAIVPSNNN